MEDDKDSSIQSKAAGAEGEGEESKDSETKDDELISSEEKDIPGVVPEGEEGSGEGFTLLPPVETEEGDRLPQAEGATAPVVVLVTGEGGAGDSKAEETEESPAAEGGEGQEEGANTKQVRSDQVWAERTDTTWH